MSYQILARLHFPLQPIALAQESPASPPTEPSQAPPQPTKHAPTGFVVEDETQKLHLSRNLPSATDRKGDQVEFEVLEDVSVGNVTVILRGAVALAIVMHLSRG